MLADLSMVTLQINEEIADLDMYDLDKLWSLNRDNYV